MKCIILSATDFRTDFNTDIPGLLIAQSFVNATIEMLIPFPIPASLTGAEGHFFPSFKARPTPPPAPSLSFLPWTSSRATSINGAVQSSHHAACSL